MWCGRVPTWYISSHLHSNTGSVQCHLIHTGGSNSILEIWPQDLFTKIYISVMDFVKMGDSNCVEICGAISRSYFFTFITRKCFSVISRNLMKRLKILLFQNNNNKKKNKKERKEKKPRSDSTNNSHFTNIFNSVTFS